jgi:type I restriction enzyme S subunit
VKFPAYPRTKTSGVEWLGDVPAHWETLRIKDVGTLRGGSGFPHEEQDVEGEELPFYKVGDLKASVDARVMGNPEHTISKETAKKLRAAIIPAEAIVYAKIGAALLLNRRRITFVNCCIDNNMTAYLPEKQRIRTDWAFYWLSTLDFGEFMNPGAVPSFSEGYQSILPVLVPPLPEQRAIVAFLDRERRRVDRLVAKKRELIERLKEKRTALISRTVTRGLPPAAARAAGLPENPPLKPSGFDWLGDIKRGKINLDEVKKVRSEDIPWGRNPLLNLGEILVVRSGAYTGDSAIVSSSVAGCIAGYDMVLSVKRGYPAFVAWALLSEYLLQGQIYLERMRAAQPHLNAEELGGLVILAPPLSEQAAIAAYLDKETAKLDALVGEVDEAVERLQEYRTALITAAVTGKIDVRKAGQRISDPPL